LSKAGFKTHDRIVQFPFWDEYKDEMKSTIADMKNVGGAFAGMITAGKFSGALYRLPIHSPGYCWSLI
jgi:leucyl aminopeptidase